MRVRFSPHHTKIYPSKSCILFNQQSYECQYFQGIRRCPGLPFFVAINSDPNYTCTIRKQFGSIHVQGNALKPWTKLAKSIADQQRRVKHKVSPTAERQTRMKRKPGRPPVNDEPKDKITIVLPAKLKEKFSKFCEKRGKSMSSALAEMIEKVLKNDKDT